MAITIDGTEITGVTIDGTTVQNINIDGVNAWQSGDDPTGSPGSNMLLAGTMTQGYFGVVTSAEMGIDGNTLASDLGLTAGISQHSTADWLKFVLNDKILFTPMKTFRYDITWNDINAVGAISDPANTASNATVTYDGITYRVRGWLMALGAEWGKTILSVHEHADDGGWEYPEDVDSANVKDWTGVTPSGTGFTDIDLHTYYTAGVGTYAWGQDDYNSNGNRATRGKYGASLLINNNPASDGGYGMAGWRPVLEVV